MSLRPYVDEYLIAPTPLHFGLNVCSHGCFYCFANLNNPQRRAENADIRWLAKWQGDDSTLTGWFLKQGYPLLVANDSDPFAASNEQTFLTLHGICQDKNIPICYQTKGGKPEHEALMLGGKPTMVYLSITSDREDILKQAEPGAPSFQHRVELALSAKYQGHHVVLGINPMLPQWWDDFPAFCARMAENGIRHAWVGSLHLNYKQIANIPAKQRQRFEPLIQPAQGKHQPATGMVLDMEDAGINVFHGSTAEKPGFWDDYFALGYPFFPTLDGWFAHLNQQSQGQPLAFSFQHFDAWANVGNPPDKSAFKDYLNGFGRSLRNAKESAKARTFSQVHEWYWKVLEYPTILRHDQLFIAQIEDEGEIATLTDDDGLAILVYAPPSLCTCEIAWRVDTSPVNLYGA